jgi:hypothetical protein
MRKRRLAPAVVAMTAALAVGGSTASARTSFGSAAAAVNATPKVTKAVRFDVTPPLRSMPLVAPRDRSGLVLDRGPVPASDSRHDRDGALQAGAATASMPSPLLTFEGIGASANPFPLAPPDPNGAVGRNHYVEMVNVEFAVYSKQGALLFGPAEIGTLWQGFLPDCQDPSGDPVVLYDKLANRWILTQFTTRGPEYFNCVAVSQTGDPLGSYYRYAFSTGLNFPDYPKYAVWPDGYYITTREFGPDDSYVGVGVYAVDRHKLLGGSADPRMVSFLLRRSPAYLPGDGLLAADLDGQRMPPAGSPEYLVGSMDDGFRYGAPFDGLNVFHVRVDWGQPESSTFGLAKSVPIAPYDTVFPCKPSFSRSCIPQPDTGNRIDILSYRQRPLFRLAYRNFGDHESLVTNQSVEAREGIAGVRWWELRNPLDPVVYQEGTYAPDDGVHRWMGSAAMDKVGNLALGYSVSNDTTVYPGIRYAGRLAGDPPGTLAQGEAVLVNGSGSQKKSARWGDYTAMTVDPANDCTFWYVNEYYQVSSANGWQTRIGAFRFPGCS